MSRELRRGARRAEARLSRPLREQLQATLREEARTPNLGDCWGPSFPPTGPQGASLAGQPGEWGRELPAPGHWRGDQACGAALAGGPSAPRSPPGGKLPAQPLEGNPAISGKLFERLSAALKMGTQPEGK